MSKFYRLKTKVKTNMQKLIMYLFVLLLLLHPFNGLFSRVSLHLKGRSILDFNDAGDDRVALASAGPYANHLHLASSSPLTLYRPDALPAAQPCQNTEAFC